MSEFYSAYWIESNLLNPIFNLTIERRPDKVENDKEYKYHLAQRQRGKRQKGQRQRLQIDLAQRQRRPNKVDNVEKSQKGQSQSEQRPKRGRQTG